jgi:hypothetical protein
MGWWSESIMGGDTPYDIEGAFEDAFGTTDRYWGSVMPAPKYKVPTAEESRQWLNDYLANSYEPDAPIAKQVAGFKLMQRGAPMADDVRALVLEGIDEEISEGCEEWSDPQLRLDTLADFRKLVVAYPAEGGKAELPHQPGLLEMIGRKS